MAKENKVKDVKNIFLSASVPESGREFYGTEDVIAIRDSVIAFASTIISNPDYHLIWGGHPSITPLISLVLERYNLKMSDRVTLYQSAHFKDKFPPQNKNVGIRIITRDTGNADSSILHLRQQMLGDNKYHAAVFIGGMKGVIEEFKMIKDYHPEVRCFPVASTGAAARMLYDEHPEEFDERLLTELSYTSLFKELLIL